MVVIYFQNRIIFIKGLKNKILSISFEVLCFLLPFNNIYDKIFTGDVMKIFKKIFKVIVSIILIVAIVMLSLFISANVAGFVHIEKNIEYQNSHLDYFKNEYYVNYTPCDEQKLANFDIQQALADGVKFNEVAFLGTHNSYQLLATKPKRALMKAVEIVTFGAVDYTKATFEMDTLTNQLEYGIRNLEIDIETVDDGENVSFIVTHDPILDNVTSCYDFAKALEEIKMWSDNNSNHLPITILIEPKGKVLNINNMQDFSLEYANELGETIKSVLGDTLLTPADMMGDYANFKEMRENDGWLTLEETLGKVMVLMHPCDVTEDYIKQDETIKSQAIFPMLYSGGTNETYTSFILDNEPENAMLNNKMNIDEYNLIVRTRADSHPTFSDERYASADVCGSQIITTDYPPRSVRTDEHTYTFDGYTVKLLKEDFYG